MDKKRIEWKVGLFVFVGLVLAAVLMVQFSKGVTFFRQTYQLRLKALNVGGLKPRASVLMSGVQVGTVSQINLAPDGRSVTIFLKIYSGYAIHADAIFRIEQSGFLGDNYVAIVPTKNEGPPLADNAEVACEQPFNLQEVARSSLGFIRRVDEAATNINAAIADVRRLVLNEETLSNLSVAVSSMRAASQRALDTVGDINHLLATNGPAVSRSVSNLDLASAKLNVVADDVDGLVVTNSPNISAVVSNLQASSESLKHILQDTQAGKGAAGVLLHNDQVATNLAAIVQNLSITTSNLNRLGLWRFLWHREQPKPTFQKLP